MRTFAAVAMLVVALLSPAAAQQQPCLPLAAFLEAIEKSHPVAAHRLLAGDEAARAVAWFNRQPPESDLVASFVVLVAHVSGQLGLLLGNEGQVCHGILLPPEAGRDLIRAIQGGPGV